MTDPLERPMAADAASWVDTLEKIASFSHAAALGFLALAPDANMTPAQIEAALLERAAKADRRWKEAREAHTTRAVCRYCDRPIIRLGQRPWLHGEDHPEDPYGSRGCRSYSFELDGGWDETLKRTWSATPA